MARETEQQKREKALMVAIARSTAELELTQDKDISYAAMFGFDKLKEVLTQLEKNKG